MDGSSVFEPISPKRIPIQGVVITKLVITYYIEATVGVLLSFHESFQNFGKMLER